MAAFMSTHATMYTTSTERPFTSRVVVEDMESRRRCCPRSSRNKCRRLAGSSNSYRDGTTFATTTSGSSYCISPPGDNYITTQESTQPRNAAPIAYISRPPWIIKNCNIATETETGKTN
jgi:hypothetical protein